MTPYITYFVTSIILGLCLCIIFSVDKKAAAAAGDVKIDAVNFPDPYVRAAVKEKDADKNGVLSQEEISKIKEITFESWDEKINKSYPLNLAGISYLTNLNKVNISAIIENGKEELLKLPKLKSFRYSCVVSGALSTDLSWLEGIEELEIQLGKVEEIILPKDNYLKKLKIYLKSTENFKKLDLSQFTNLTSLFLWVDNPSNIMVSSAPNLTYYQLRLHGKKPLLIENIAQIKELKIEENADVPDVTVRNCPALQKFSIDNGNKLKKVNLSTLPNLKELNIKTEKLKELNVSSLTNLTKIKLITPKLKKLVVSQKSKLHTLWIFASDLTNLDMSRMRKIESLDIRSKKIKKINMSYAKQLQYLHMYNLKNLKHLDLSKQKKLIQLDLASMKKLKKIVFPKKKISWERIELVNCKALDIPMEKLSKVKELCVRGNKKISTLDLRKFKRLYELEWTEGVLKKVKWGKPKKLTFLNVNSNKLSGKWDLRKNLSGVSKIECYDNRLTTIIGGKHNVLLYCDKNRLKKVDMRATKNLAVLSCVKNKGVRVYMPTELEDGPNVDRSAKVIYKK